MCSKKKKKKKEKKETPVEMSTWFDLNLAIWLRI
jgi:hypothetical protein